MRSPPVLRLLKQEKVISCFNKKAALL